MFRKLQKKSHSAKKTILTLALIGTCILIVPLWIFSFQKSLNNSKRTQRAVAKNSALSDLTVLQENFSTVLEEFENALDKLEQSASTDTALPSYPQTSDQPVLPKSDAPR